MSSDFFTGFSIIDHLKATISKTAISFKRQSLTFLFEAIISLEVIHYVMSFENQSIDLRR